ncbi:hypothetical protein [Comamonas resistens]|uniref:Uncharacterized protein n=1 Tax=Comamonas resistens TaxID=3046670 RepID=A0ABY8SM06_9BURK|nr:hypothetical protein [Comamonas resistens]MDL5038208.1 hypothetical protein [Comamonas resistens]WHS63978.1 hypothetical protein QMY55_15840 [Comamonas resistens]
MWVSGAIGLLSREAAETKNGSFRAVADSRSALNKQSILLIEINIHFGNIKTVCMYRLLAMKQQEMMASRCVYANFVSFVIKPK